MVATGPSLDSPVQDAVRSRDTVVGNPKLTSVLDDADDLLGLMRCAYGIEGLDDKSRGARIFLTPEGTALTGSDGRGAAGLTKGNGVVVVTPEHPEALSHELGHALTVSNGLGIFGPRTMGSSPGSAAFAEGVAEANSLLLLRYGQTGRPGFRDDLRKRVIRVAGIEHVKYGSNGPIVLSPLDFLPGAPATNPHERGFVVVQLLQELRRLITNQRVSNPSGCSGEGDPIGRWWAQSLRTLSGGTKNPAFTEWCNAMATTAPNWGVDPREVQRRFRQRGILCGSQDEEDPTLSLPATCPLVGASAEPSRTGSGLVVRPGGACGV